MQTLGPGSPLAPFSPGMPGAPGDPGGPGTPAIPLVPGKPCATKTKTDNLSWNQAKGYQSISSCYKSKLIGQ